MPHGITTFHKVLAPQPFNCLSEIIEFQQRPWNKHGTNALRDRVTFVLEVLNNAPTGTPPIHICIGCMFFLSDSTNVVQNCCTNTKVSKTAGIVMLYRLIVLVWIRLKDIFSISTFFWWILIPALHHRCLHYCYTTLTPQYFERLSQTLIPSFCQCEKEKFNTFYSGYLIPLPSFNNL